MNLKKEIDFKTNNFDVLRLIAATQVVFDHYFQHINLNITAFGKQILYLFPGVPVFFIISGYLISASYERNQKLQIYIKNRALRIYPGLWGCIILSVIVISFTGVNFFNFQTLSWLPCQLAGLIYTPGFLSNYGFGSYNGSLWSIPVELQFYIVLPVLYFLIPKKKSVYWFIALMLCFLLFTYWWQTNNNSSTSNKLIGYSFAPGIYLFLFGVILQKTKIYCSSLIYNKAWLWIIIYLIYVFTMSPVMEMIVFNYVRNIILGFVIVSLAYTFPGIGKKILGTTDISYGIYIYHGLVMTVIVQLKLTHQINLFLILLITYLLALASWLVIERPFIKRKERTIKAVK